MNVRTKHGLADTLDVLHAEVVRIVARRRLIDEVANRESMILSGPEYDRLPAARWPTIPSCDASHVPGYLNSADDNLVLNQ